ncbi:MAG: type II toxin-antitoxin system HicB family antitoxin [Bacteroidota bacterium]
MLRLKGDYSVVSIKKDPFAETIFINTNTVVRLKHNILQLKLKHLLHKEDVDSYTLTIPDLAHCITFGNNIEPAIPQSKKAIELFIENRSRIMKTALISVLSVLSIISSWSNLEG